MSSEETLPGWRQFQSPKRKGRGLERFVAAIKKLEASGADVRWDERIKGRQFDVTVRVQEGADKCLTVVECRDLSNRVPVKDVEAFVTKASDVNASRMVMVSRKGFTRGAVKAAKKHGVELCMLQEFVENWPTRLMRESREALNIRKVEFLGPGEVRHSRSDPEEDFLQATVLVLPGGEKGSFSQMIEAAKTDIVFRLRRGPGPQVVRIPFPPGSSVVFPGEKPQPFVAMSFEAELISVVQMRRRTGPVNVEKIRRYEYSQIGSAEAKTFADHELRLGFDTVLHPGAFYRNALGLTYKCLGVQGDEARMILLDLQRHQGIAAVAFKMAIDLGKDYVRIEDPEECRKLEDLFAKLPGQASSE